MCNGSNNFWLIIIVVWFLFSGCNNGGGCGDAMQDSVTNNGCGCNGGCGCNNDCVRVVGNGCC